MLDTPPPLPGGVFELFLRSTIPDPFAQLTREILKATPWRCNNCIYRQTACGLCYMCGQYSFERVVNDEQ